MIEILWDACVSTFKFLRGRPPNRKVWFKQERWWPVCLAVDLRRGELSVPVERSADLRRAAKLHSDAGQLFHQVGEFISRPYQTRWSLGAFEELSDSHRPTFASFNVSSFNGVSSVRQPRDWSELLFDEQAETREAIVRSLRRPNLLTSFPFRG